MRATQSLPTPRGPITAQLFARWTADDRTSPSGPATSDVDAVAALVDDDLHLALYCIEELGYRGFAGVDPAMEVDPTTTAWRQELRDRFEAALRAATAFERRDPTTYLREVTADNEGPSLSGLLLDVERADWFREFLVHRSPYQLKEADPHSWAIPRMWGRPKSALVEIQLDEYGGGRPGLSHAELFATTLRAAGLDDTYGAYLDHVPGVTLATTNLISLFGSQRRLVPALVGHLALFEMTSVGPMGRYARLCDLFGLGPAGRRFFGVHVEADEHHGPLALTELVGGLLEQDPGCGPEITFGAAALSLVEGAFAEHLRSSWASGRSSLRRPLTASSHDAAGRHRSCAA